jgi:hypothetical protein
MHRFTNNFLDSEAGIPGQVYSSPITASGGEVRLHSCGHLNFFLLTTAIIFIFGSRDDSSLTFFFFAANKSCGWRFKCPYGSGTGLQLRLVEI